MQTCLPGIICDRRASGLSRVGWSLLGNAAYAASQLGIIFTLARLPVAGLTPADAVGVLTFHFALVAPFVVFSQLQLRQLLLMDKKLPSPFPTYYRLRCQASVVAFICCLPLGLIFFFAGGYLGYCIVAAAKSFESVGDICYAEMYRAGRFRCAAATKAIKGILTCSAFAAVLYATMDLDLAIASLALVWLAFLMGVERPLASCRASLGGGFHLSPHLPVTNAKALMLRGLPLGLAAVLVSVQSVTPRIVVGWVGGNDALGVFAIASQLCMLLTLVTAALAQVVSTPLSRLVESGKTSEYRQLVARLLYSGVSLSFFVIAATWVAGRQFIAFVYGFSIAGNEATLLILVLAACVSAFAALYAVLLHAVGKPHKIIVGTCIGTACSVFGSVFLIPRYGGLAAAIVTLTANCAVASSHILLLKVQALEPELAQGSGPPCARDRIISPRAAA